MVNSTRRVPRLSGAARSPSTTEPSDLRQQGAGTLVARAVVRRQKIFTGKRRDGQLLTIWLGILGSGLVVANNNS
jgi:hypothetical protein